ncbi:hypothetical protein NIES19_11440 [Anabaena cylindrica PCC 7122]|nr:hypothetical protein NIES19_11440 [Anabaena cylindrica PCC 7122]
MERLYILFGEVFYIFQPIINYQLILYTVSQFADI